MAPKPKEFNSSLWEHRENGCWQWIGARDTKGYGRFGKTARAHRVAWIYAFGQIPSGLHVLHRCDNPGCVNPDHLFLGTNAENVRDKVKKGRQARGLEFRSLVVFGRSSQCKLNESDVERIRDIRKHSAFSQAGIARYFGVHQSHVSRILSSKRRVAVEGR